MAPLQQIKALVPRDLKDRDPHFRGPALSPQVRKDLVEAKALDGAHRVGLAAARLPVHEDRALAPEDRRLHQLCRRDAVDLDGCRWKSSSYETSKLASHQGGASPEGRASLFRAQHCQGWRSR